MRNTIIALVFSLTLGGCAGSGGHTDSIGALPIAIALGVGVAVLAH